MPLSETEYITKDNIFDIVFGEFCARSDETEQVLNDIIEQVRAIPAADIAPVRHGEWIVCGDGLYVPYLCSHCGKTVPAILIEKYSHNYCPNCGAKMDVR